MAKLFKLGDEIMDDGVVHCHGVFDVLHAGHLEYFKAAKAFGQVLVVTITSDQYVNKGPGRPYFPAETRAAMVAALEIVDYVAISDHPTAIEAIRAIRPAYYVKGPDYKDYSRDVTGEIANEEATVKACGGEIKFTDTSTYSSSTLANKFLVNWTDEQSSTIEKMRSLNCAETLRKTLADIAKLKVLIIGEPIVDTYRFCEPQGISSKSPSISAKFISEENYAGGSLAIANHLADFCECHLLFTHGNEDGLRELLNFGIDKRVYRYPVKVNAPTPRKTRYISHDKQQRIFEITDLVNDQWTKTEHNYFAIIMKELAMMKDMIIVADFGHGLFEGDILSAAQEFKTMKALNVQTNSSNFGFNPFTKHESWQYLSIDKRELQVAFHDRNSSVEALSNSVRLRGQMVSVTLGPGGAKYYSFGREHSSPAFVDHVVDATGAGDAYFAITSLLAKTDIDPAIIPFVGNVYAGLKTKIIGNKASVSKALLIKAVEGILK